MTGYDDAIQPDLDFLKSLVDGGGRQTQYLTGHAFVVAGGLYSFQCIATWFGLVFTPNMPSALWLILGFAPTVLLIAYFIVQGIRFGTRNTGNATSRAITATFQAAGFANIALILIFMPAALTRQDWSIWMFYPAVVFALQGAAWLTAYQLRRRTWLLVVGLGWLVSAVMMGWLIGTTVYMLVGWAALFFFMAIPGAAMMRLSKKPD